MKRFKILLNGGVNVADLFEELNTCCSVSGGEESDNARNDLLLVLLTIQQLAQLQI